MFAVTTEDTDETLKDTNVSHLESASRVSETNQLSADMTVHDARNDDCRKSNAVGNSPQCMSGVSERGGNGVLAGVCIDNYAYNQV